MGVVTLTCTTAARNEQQIKVLPGHCEEFPRVAGQGVGSHTCMAFPGKLNAMCHTVHATNFQMHARANKTHI